MNEANLKLLGAAIRSFREQAQPKKISQFRLAILMGWEGTAPVIEIEKGRRLPRPETLNALGEALQLSPADIAYLHGLAGYRMPTALPPLAQVKRVLGAIAPELAHRLYPAYVMDYQLRFWMINSATAAFQGGSFDLLERMMAHAADGFRMVFDSRLPLREGLLATQAIERELIFRFKAYNLYRRHEPFYRQYPHCLQADLLPADYALFAQRWDEVDVRMQDIFPLTPQLSVQVESLVLRFEIHMVEIVHLDRLLFVGYYEPLDDGVGNRERCEAYFRQHSPSNKSCIQIWDFQKAHWE